MKLNTLALTVASLALASAANAVTLTTFGTGSFTVETSLTTFITSQDTVDIDIAGFDTFSLAGFISPTDLGDTAGNTTLYLSGLVPTEPGSPFTITLFDGEFETATFVGGSWSEIQTNGFNELTFSTADVNFDADMVGAIQLDTAGTGDGSIAATLTSLATTAPVPEPSTYAALAGLCVLGYVMVRRRK